MEKNKQVNAEHKNCVIVYLAITITTKH